MDFCAVSTAARAGVLVAAECWWLQWERAVGGGGRSMAEKCGVPARRSHFRSELSPLAEGAPSSF